MSWSHEYLPESHILVVNVVGVVNRSAWENQLRSSLEEAQKRSCYRFLVDYRQARVRLGFLDLYERPAHYEVVGMPHSARIALLFGPQEMESAFIETVAANRGYEVRVFEDPETARAWLQEAPTDPHG